MPKSPKTKGTPKVVLKIKGKAKEISTPSTLATSSPRPHSKKKNKTRKVSKKAGLEGELEDGDGIIDLTWDEGEDGDALKNHLDMDGPVAGPSRLPDVASNSMSTSTPYRPIAYTPLTRSLVSSLNIRLSPSPPAHTSALDEQATLNQPEIFLIEEILVSPPKLNHPLPAKPAFTLARLSAKHFDPPGMFTTSMIPAIIASSSAGSKAAAEPKSQKSKAPDSGLLLPSHVIVDSPSRTANGDDSIADDVDMEDISMEGVHVVDDDLSRGVPRYFLPTSPKQTEAATFLATADQSQMCRNCKRPGHKERDCPHIICTTCGAEDEHERRNCPVSLVCFGCGQRGHRKVDCPDPISRHSRRTGCDLCGSWDHMENTCPSLWRIYSYRSSGERRDVQAEKNRAKGWAREAIGGEGKEEWCYNCAQEGHLGDDCQQRRGSLSRAVSASAFSERNARRGPFRSTSQHKSSSRQHRSYHDSTPRQHHRFDDDDELPGVNPGFQGGNVGKKGKDREKQRMMEKAAKTEDDDGDWFGSRSKGNEGKRNERGWDSERRPSTFKNRDDHTSRKGTSSTSLKTKSNGTTLPFSHRHLVDSNEGPSSAPAKSISFGKLSLPGGEDSGMDSPTTNRISRGSVMSSKEGNGNPSNGKGKKFDNPALAVVQRALAGGNTPKKARHRDRVDQSSPLVRETGSGVNRRDTPKSGTNTPTGNGSSRKNRKGKTGVGNGGKGEDRDWENEWRRSGEGGGNVASWGKEFDKLDKKFETPSGKRKGGVNGQRYLGSY